MEFRVYTCDCVGFEVEGPEGPVAFCVSPCDGDAHSPGLTLYQRDGLQEKESKTLGADKTLVLLLRLGSLIADGNGLRELRSLHRQLGLAPPRG